MKKILIFGILFLSSIAFADLRTAGFQTKINTLTKFELENNRYVTVEYSIGGGCQPHSTELKIDIIQEKYSVVALVTVLDVTPDLDTCEAMMHIKQKMNLSDAIAEALEEKDLHGGNINGIEVRLNSSFRVNL